LLFAADPGSQVIMVPDEYHDFFLGAITVAGALVGLLFVAISVNPGSLADDTRVAMRIRATSALLAFLDALFVSLVALLPHGAVGKAAMGIGAAGALSMVTLLAALLTRRRHLPRRELIHMTLLVVGQGVIYAWQVVGAAHLAYGGPVDSGINLQAVLIIVFFAFGVFRAWEYVGGARTGVIGTVDELRHRPAVAARSQE
jgi:hypothetical protein